MATKEKKTDGGGFIRMAPPVEQTKGGIVDPDSGETVIYEGPSDVPAAHAALLAAQDWSEEK